MYYLDKNHFKCVCLSLASPGAHRQGHSMNEKVSRVKSVTLDGYSISIMYKQRERPSAVSDQERGCPSTGGWACGWGLEGSLTWLLEGWYCSSA